MSGGNADIVEMLQNIAQDRGIPKNIKVSIEDLIRTLGGANPDNEKIASIISTLDEASGDPNISMPARTNIWNVISILEDYGTRVGSE